jgi:hypothetical protein
LGTWTTFRLAFLSFILASKISICTYII